MSLYVLLVNRIGQDRPGWDFGMAGDKQFPSWMAGLKAVYADHDQELFRPADIAEWRAALPPDRPNPDRFLEMFDILEAEPDMWIYYSF